MCARFQEARKKRKKIFPLFLRKAWESGGQKKEEKTRRFVFNAVESSSWNFSVIRRSLKRKWYYCEFFSFSKVFFPHESAIFGIAILWSWEITKSFGNYFFFLFIIFLFFRQAQNPSINFIAIQSCFRLANFF